MKYVSSGLVIGVSIACTGIGFLAGYIYGTKHYEKILLAELDDMESYYAKLYPSTPAYPHVVDIQKIKDKNERQALKNVKYEKPEKIDYTKFYTVTDQPDPAECESPSDDDPDTGYSMTQEFHDNKQRPPRIIKGSEFGNTPGYDTMSLKYYVENDTLVAFEDENTEDLIYFDEVEDWIGDALTKFGFDQNDEPRIWVRNYQRGCDYEIIKVFGAYGDD